MKKLRKVNTENKEKNIKASASTEKLAKWKFRTCWGQIVDIDPIEPIEERRKKCHSEK